MKPSTVPDGMPVLSRGRHRTPRRGACVMELTSLLAGERWSDHPACTHPLLAELARLVNDHIGDVERQRLAPLIPSLVHRRGDEHTWLTLPVSLAARTILDVPESTQRVLAAGLLRVEQLCTAAGPELDVTRRQAGATRQLVPGAVAWVDQLGVRDRIDMRSYTRHGAPTMVRCMVQGVVASEAPDRDRRLRELLEVGIAACPRVLTPPTPVPVG